MFHQARNLMDLMEMIIRQKAPENLVSVELITAPLSPT